MRKKHFWLLSTVGTLGFSLLVVALLVFPSERLGAQTIPTQGLVGYWSFDEGSGLIAADGSGNGNTGTLVNNPVWVPGHIGGAVSLNGSNQYIAVASNPVVGLDGMPQATFAAWINAASLGQNNQGRIFDKGGGSSISSGYTIALASSNRIQAQVNSVIGDWHATSGSNVFSINTWHHIAAVYDGAAGRVDFYVDGVFVGSDAIQANTAIIGNAQEMRIGLRATDLNRDFDGLIDEARIYNRALSASEINSLFLQSSTDVQPPVISNGQPIGTLPFGTTQTTISVDTNETAICRYATVAGTPYPNMVNTFSTTSGLSHSAIVTGLIDGGSYNYYVRCEDVAANQNQTDFVISFSIGSSLDIEPPTVPVGLQASGVSSSQINVSWSASTDNVGVTGYNVFRDAVQVATATGTTYSDTGLAASTTYTYTVNAFDAAGNTSSQSAGVQGITLASSSQAPYPASSVITNASFDLASHITLAPGSDNWPMTWSNDNHQYTSWGDGGGFGGTNILGRVSLGFGRVEGDFGAYQGFNVWGGFNPENPALFEGKSYGMLSVNGVLYAWWGPGSNTTFLSETRLLSSTDKGATWTQAPWTFTSAQGISSGAFINAGQDYIQARDGFVYSYFVNLKNTSSLVIQQPGEIVLARVPTTSILDQASYEFFTGFDVLGNPTWGPITNRQPVFQDANGVGWTVSGIYNPGLNRYLLVTEHTQSISSNLGIFDAPNPWGPWTTVTYESNWGNFGNPFYWNFAPKWFSPDGKDFTLVFTGIGANDSWNTVRGRFTASTTIDTIPPSVPQNVGATNITGTSIALSWSASTDNVGVTGYNIFRNDVLAATIVGTSYIDIGLLQGTTYTYEVSALDAAGNESARSVAYKGTTITSSVSTKHVVGNTATTSANLNVRSAPSIEAGIAGVEPTGGSGTVSDGPVLSDGLWWWAVQYISGLTGWSVEDFLE